MTSLVEIGRPLSALRFLQRAYTTGLTAVITFIEYAGKKSDSKDNV